MPQAEPQRGANAIRDLGYRPYVGDRLPPSHNTQVLLMQSMRRAWSSWMVKVAVSLGWLPTVIGLGVYYIVPMMTREPMKPGALIAETYAWQTWLVLTLVTLGAGAGAIAEDFQFKSFQFYFAKPVTRAQYLGGRVGAVAIWTFLLLAIPGLILVLTATGSADEGERLPTLGLALPMLIQATLAAAVLASASVGVSSLSKSRALTMTAWMVLLFVPHMLASIVDAVGDWPWLRLVSLPALLQEVSAALFKVEDETAIEWYHALPVLIALAIGGVALARRRLGQAEVIA